MFDCSHGAREKCIPLEKVCDENDDCGDSVDESPELCLNHSESLGFVSELCLNHSESLGFVIQALSESQRVSLICLRDLSESQRVSWICLRRSHCVCVTEGRWN